MTDQILQPFVDPLLYCSLVAIPTDSILCGVPSTTSPGVGSMRIADLSPPRSITVFRNCIGYNNCNIKQCIPSITNSDCGLCIPGPVKTSTSKVNWVDIYFPKLKSNYFYLASGTTNDAEIFANTTQDGITFAWNTTK